MQDSWQPKEEQQKTLILYLGVGTAVYPAAVTGYCVHFLPYVSTGGEKNHPGKRNRLSHPLLRCLMPKLEIYYVSPLLTL